MKVTKAHCPKERKKEISIMRIINERGEITTGLTEI